MQWTFLFVASKEAMHLSRVIKEGKATVVD